MVKPFYKPIERPEREEVWYCYYVPQRRKGHSESPTARIPISQVPDLTNEARVADIKNEKGRSTRGLVRETDSKYVKLAKSGGRRNLLCYHENERKLSGPQAYKVPEWYYHDGHGWPEERQLSEDEKFKKYKVTYGKRSYKTVVESKVYQRPDYMTHPDPEEIKRTYSKPTRIPDRPIFGYDTHSVWKRDELENVQQAGKLPSLADKKDVKKAQVTGREAKQSAQTTSPVKLPDTCKGQLPGQRNLATSGYATEWYDKWCTGAVRV